MTREEAIRYACRIRTLVWRSIDPQAQTACDCICADAPGVADFRDNSEALDVILDVVRIHLSNRLDIPSFDEAAMYRGRPKCDGHHAGPRCADPECWNDEGAYGHGV